jgi:hypothetical protein
MAANEAAAGVERAKHLANKVVRMLNGAEPADALTALQLVVASMLEHTGIQPEVFFHRVIVSVERIRSGSLPVKEEASG